MLAQKTRDAVYAASIVGGILVILLVICLSLKLRGRRRAAIRRRVQRELQATTEPRKQVPRFVFQQEVEISFPPHPAVRGRPGRENMVYRHGDVLLPFCMAERFRRKDEYIRSALGEAYPMHLSDDRQRLLAPDELNLPAAAHVLQRQDCAITTDGTVEPQTSRRPISNEQARTVTSRLSGNKLKLAVDWMKTQGEKITGNEVASSRSALPKPGVLKNQASKPNLAPRTLIKQASEVHLAYDAVERTRRPIST